MNEADKLNQQLQRAVETAQKLQALEGMEGWDIVKSWMREAQALSLRTLANNEKTPNMDKVIWYQSMYQHAEKFFQLLENAKISGQQAQKRLEKPSAKR